jgi:hypothetical protein
LEDKFMMSRFLTLIVIGTFSVAMPMAYAQDAASPVASEENVGVQGNNEVAVEAATAKEETNIEAEAEGAATSSSAESDVSDAAKDFERRLELAREMHKLRPTAEQVDAAVESVASRLPPEQAGNFKINAGNMLNYRAIENISINAMAETFTIEELEAMVDYYSKPEAKSIAGKYEAYQQKVGPEIVKMIDRAIMKLRTGDAAP